MELVQRKLANLQDENAVLKGELNSLQEQTLEIEEKEQKLARDCVNQLGKSVSYDIINSMAIIL